MNINHAELAPIFFLQMVVILAACRGVGWIAAKVEQPQVIGEMIAGVLLGPSLLGVFFPNVQQYLFPKEARGILHIGAQLGVGLYIFLVGVEFKAELFRKRLRSALSVSIAGMTVPFVLGGGLALWLVKQPGLFTKDIAPYQAALFLGAAMSIYSVSNACSDYL